MISLSMMGRGRSNIIRKSETPILLVTELKLVGQSWQQESGVVGDKMLDRSLPDVVIKVAQRSHRFFDKRPKKNAVVSSLLVLSSSRSRKLIRVLDVISLSRTCYPFPYGPYRDRIVCQNRRRMIALTSVVVSRDRD